MSSEAAPVRASQSPGSTRDPGPRNYITQAKNCLPLPTRVGQGDFLMRGNRLIGKLHSVAGILLLAVNDKKAKAKGIWDQRKNTIQTPSK